MPKEYRDAMGLETGAPVSALRIGDGLILMPENERFNKLCDSIRAALEGEGVSESQLQATLEETRERVFARRYPKASQKVSPKRAARKH